MVHRKLSYQWRTILGKLAEHGLDGVDENAFVTLMGEGEIGRHNPARTGLNQMYFSGVSYWEYHPSDAARIRITSEGREALQNDR